MLDEVITTLSQVTAGWLTRVLAQSGALDAGRVESFDADSNERELSTSAKLKLSYTSDSRGDCPIHLFLKMVNTDMEVEFFGPSEVFYYTRDYVGVNDVPIPKCYHAAYSETLGRYHVLIDDLSLTHVPSYNRTPTLEHGLALAEGLAAMHVHWWGEQRLTQVGERLPNAEAIQRFVNIARPGAGFILAACADQLKPHWPELIRELYEKHPPVMIERARDANGFTLIHGDTNLSNILIPTAAERPLYIVDRQPFDWSLTAWLGVYDLAYTLVLKWESDIRRQLEEPILKHYHAQLIQRGVHGYSWERLWDDYRISAAMGVYVATEWCRGGLNRDTQEFWLPMLQRTLTALDDLNCAALFSRNSVLY